MSYIRRDCTQILLDFPQQVQTSESSPDFCHDGKFQHFRNLSNRTDLFLLTLLSGISFSNTVNSKFYFFHTGFSLGCYGLKSFESCAAV